MRQSSPSHPTLSGRSALIYVFKDPETRLRRSTGGNDYHLPPERCRRDSPRPRRKQLHCSAPLRWTLREYLGLVRLLDEAGADVDAENLLDMTPLYDAAAD
ncbi:hypothetical protein BDW68DRAFT_59928 [Aspergillus falconensis]